MGGFILPAGKDIPRPIGGPHPSPRDPLYTKFHLASKAPLCKG